MHIAICCLWTVKHETLSIGTGQPELTDCGDLFLTALVEIQETISAIKVADNIT